MFRRRRKPEILWKVETSTGAQVLFLDPRDAFALCQRELLIARVELGHARSLHELQERMVGVLRAQLEASGRALEEYRGHLVTRTSQLRACEAVSDAQARELRRLRGPWLERLTS